MGPEIELLDEPDPIKASYDVFIRPHLKDGRMLYIMQFPNRGSNQHYSAGNGCEPLELRLKPKSGLVELDVPLDAKRNYDKEKGLKWGQAMLQSNQGKGSGGASHGLPGGFGIGGAQIGRGRGSVQNLPEELAQGEIEEQYDRLLADGQVLTKQTLGGQIVPKESTTPQYMIGAFHEGQLHLTPVDQMVQMRPQFHYIDASAEVERASKPRETAPSRTTEPRAIHMTVKATVDGEEETTDTMAERIRSAQEEPWKRLRYVDEDNHQAWQTYREDLFMQETDIAPKLVSSLGNAEFLDAISAPRDAARLSRAKKVKRSGARKGVKGTGKGKGKEKENIANGEESESSMTLSDSPSASEGVI